MVRLFIKKKYGSPLPPPTTPRLSVLQNALFLVLLPEEEVFLRTCSDFIDFTVLGLGMC